MDNSLESASEAIEHLLKLPQTIENLDNHLKQIKVENEAYKIVRQKQEDIINQQSQQIDQEKEANAKLQIENKGLNDTIEEKNILIDQLRQRIAELEGIQSKIEQDLQNKNEECQKLEENNKQLQEQINEISQKEQQTEQKVQKLEQELDQMQNELQVAKSQQVQKEIETVQGAKEQEAQAYIEMINNVLKDDASLKGRIPMDAENVQIFNEKLKDGVILCKFLNGMLPNTIDPRAINMKEPLEEEHMLQNLNMAISGAKSHGCMLGALNSEQIYNGEQEEVLNMIWQIVRASLINTINVQNCPNLLSLKENEENQENFMKLPPEEMLMRWVNNHLKSAHIHRTANNFSQDLKDGEILLGLTNYLEKYQWSNEVNNEQKIKKAIKGAQAMGSETLVRSETVAEGHKRLGLLFCAQLFKAVPGLKAISEDESKELATLIEGQDVGDSREERTFRMWINSLCLQNVQYLTNLYEDITDGVVLLRILDHMQPGCVNWDKVQKKPTHFLQKTANCNMFMEIAKKSLGLQLIAIGSEDILNKNKKLVLAIIWQLMIKDVMKTIGDLKEADLVKWGNERVGNKEPKIKTLKDPNIKNSVFLFNLLAAINPKLIDWSIVQEDEDTESLKSNAQYIISIVRKLGASLFIVWEDIIELKTKMIMTLFASLKTYDSSK